MATTNFTAGTVIASSWLNDVDDITYRKSAEIVSVKDPAYGAVGDGITDDTAAINAAIAYVASLTYGGAVFFPVGVYAVTEINASLLSTGFNKTVKLYGLGRNMSRIIPIASGNVLLNLMGSNQIIVEDLHFDSTALASQCAIFLARTTVSTNCNNNKFSGLYFTGSYTKAAVVSNGSESSNWYGCRFENTNATPNYRCFWAGGGSLIGALQSITTVNGGTVLSTSNPATDNKMFGCEFYAPFASAYPVRFSQAASYTFTGCTIIGGTADTCRLVTYGDPDGGRFNGPITWIGCHFEVFGTGNVVHYLSGGGSTIYDGINNYGGYYVLNDATNIVDHDRQTVGDNPTLLASTWTPFTTSPNSVNTKFYVGILNSCNIKLSPNDADGYLYVWQYIQRSFAEATYYYQGATRGLGCYNEQVVTAVPTTGTYTVGQTLVRETPVVGQPIGWKCTVSGTLGTLNGGATTGSITSGSNVLTVSSATGLAEGQRIDVATSSGGPYYIRKLSGTTAYLDSNAGATVVGGAVSFSAATLVAMANL